MPEIGPAPVLSLVVGAFYACVYMLIRGAIGVRMLFVFVAAVLGAFVGQGIGQRVDDPLQFGDFGLISASVGACAGILLVAFASTLWPSGERS